MDGSDSDNKTYNMRIIYQDSYPSVNENKFIPFFSMENHNMQ